jgi:Flp pilus assembly protein TadD
MPSVAVATACLCFHAKGYRDRCGAAHAFLSWCLHHRFARGGLNEEDRIAAIEHARAGIARGNDDSTALAVAALVIAFDEHDTTTALKLFDRAIELSNSNVIALSLSAVVLAWTGRFELAVERAARAIRLSPFDSYNFRSHQALAITHFSAGRFADAVEAARHVIDYNPSFSPARAVMAAALLRASREGEAKTAIRDFLAREPDFTIHGFSRAIALEPIVFGPFAQAWRELGLPE